MSNEPSVNKRPKVIGKVDRQLAKVKAKKIVPNRGQNMLSVWMEQDSKKFLLTLP